MLTEQPQIEWDLSDLYLGLDDPAITQDFLDIRQRAEAFERAFKGKIAAGTCEANTLALALTEYDAILRLLARPGTYAQLMFAADASDQARGALVQRTQLESTSVNKHLLFFDLELGAMPEAVFAALISDPRLSSYRHYLEYQRIVARHNLSEVEEKLVDELANTGKRAFNRLYEEVLARANFEVELKGGVQKLTESETLSLLYDPDRSVRKAAADAITRTMRENSHVLAFIFNNSLQHKEIVDRLRGYEFPQQARHETNEIDAEVVQHVVDVVSGSFDIVNDYYKLKSQLLGIDDLTVYDRYAPISAQATTIDFNQAKRIVLGAFGRFSPKMRTKIEPFFEKRWIDAALRPGKTGGAFCDAMTPDHHPYVFMNYTGKARDVMTLAHELGHGLHDVLASNQNYLNYHPSLPLAETASVFAEMLVFERLRAEIEDPHENLALLCGKIEDTFATVFRQVCLYQFEVSAHLTRRAEGELPAERYGELWQERMQQMFGDSLELGEDHKWWWLYIHHVFAVPFYVYAYAFGELMVLSLYAQYRREGAPFVDKYLALLAAGGSGKPADLLAEMGIDIHEKAFWQGGIEMIREMVEEARTSAV
jgi:oligoendopeptidase F